MNYKRKNNTKYNHYLSEEYGFLLGVDKNITNEEVGLFINNPMQIFNDGFYGKAMQLGFRDRNILIATVEEWQKSRAKKCSFNGVYWDILLDFIFQIYNKTEYDLAKDITRLEQFKGYDEKNLYDSIEKMKENKDNIREFADSLVDIICYACKITRDVVKTGQGIFYYVKDCEKDMLELIDSDCTIYKKINIKKKIMDMT